MHRLTGILAYITANVAVVYWLYSGWGMKMFGEQYVQVLAGLSVLATICTILQGFVGAKPPTKDSKAA